MTEINIAAEIDELMIFDDPEYCSNEKKKCKFVDMENSRCNLFFKNGAEYIILDKIFQVSEDKLGSFANLCKCDQCKQVRNKVKNKTNKNNAQEDLYDEFYSEYPW
jgi:hypothetical protein